MRKTDILLTAGARKYTVGTVILLYTILMVWLYMIAPVLLVIVGVVSAFILLAGTLERWQPREKAPSPTEKPAEN